MVEKKDALKWIKAGIDIPGFEAPGYTPSEDAHAPPIPLATDPLNVDTKATEPESEKPQKPSSLPGLKVLLTHPRPLTVFALCLLNGLTFGGLLDTGLTLYLQEFYGLGSLGAGLVFLSLIIPTFFASPLAGWATDRFGAKWICFGGVVLSIPAYACLVIRGPLPLLIFFLCLLGFSLSAFLSPVMHDLSVSIRRRSRGRERRLTLSATLQVLISETPGMSSSHSFSLFNLSYSIGAFIGPIIAGQVLDALGTQRGWWLLAGLGAGLSAVLLLPIAIWLGGPIKGREKVEGKGGEPLGQM